MISEAISKTGLRLMLSDPRTANRRSNMLVVFRIPQRQRRKKKEANLMPDKKLVEESQGEEELIRSAFGESTRCGYAETL